MRSKPNTLSPPSRPSSLLRENSKQRWRDGFGELAGLTEGASFANRRALSQAGVHRPTQAGISGSSTEGADPIVVSGGYVDDQDFGEAIVYTGHGGRDEQTGRQVADQRLERGNLALAVSCREGLPVRVIRGPSPRFTLRAPGRVPLRWALFR